ncbi:MAG TPA: amino acid adenylation domain-containing protein [Candidatus Angelobacter sp.]|nr:amino acid adenylation domain-containing protein [Candidatus Angelobacter sp.]
MKPTEIPQQNQAGFADSSVSKPAMRQSTIPRRPPSAATAPLSFHQRQLWFLHRVMPENPAYNIATSLRIQRRLDVPILERALNEVLRRHEILRTRFAESAEGEPAQIIAPFLHVAIERESLMEVRGSDQERRLEDSLMEESRRSFNLDHLPLLRAKVVHLGIDDHVFLLVLHHIIADGWSLPILFKELETLYQAYERRDESPLPDLPLQYADYASWQKEQFECGALQSDLAYWKNELYGAPEILELPVDYRRPETPKFDGATTCLDLQPALVDGLKRLRRRGAASFYMTMLAAYAAVLHRYSGQDEVLIGTPVAIRERPELQELIGFFVNMVVVRVNLHGNPSFIELLERVRKTALDAYKHQNLPFQILVEELKPERNLKTNPLFQVAFSMVFEEAGMESRSGTWPAFRGLNNGTFKFDMGAIVRQTAAGCSLDLGYNTGLFSPETCERFKQHFQSLLETIVARPDAGISTIPLLLPEEDRMLRGWRQNQREYPRSNRIEQVFLSQVERTPDAPALAYPSKSFTYRELDQAADRVARYLRRLGAGPETVVGIGMERSWEMVVAMLATLKAGAAYLPLDPGYPSSRLQFMLEDTGASVLLTQISLRDAFPKTLLGRCMFACFEEIPDSQDSLAPVLPDPESLAYIIYTSGSTGTPKGIGVPHRGVTRLVCNTDYVSLGPGERIAQASTFSFDAATFEIWGALLTGGCIVGLSRAESLDSGLLAACIRREEITTMFLTTALFNQFAASENAEVFAELKCLLFGGEAVDLRWVDHVLRSCAPKRLIHVYGPTENTTFSTWQHVHSLPPRSMTVPIGGPIANTDAYVLAKTLTPVPTGVVGELYLGGEGLARGYVNRPDLTAEKFIPNPFSTRGGERLYCSGDLVRYTAQGEIQFVGRTDQQVKIRGFRIEPGEIESVLRQHPAVRESLVLVEQGRGENSLVAYVATAESNSILPELRQHLKEKLPAYMAPAKLVLVAKFPLTENGKIDRARLLEQAAEAESDNGDGEENPYVEPRNELEWTLASIWKEILEVDRVGIHDNIFNLGGHSLLFMRIHARIRKQLPNHSFVKVTDLFLYPTIDSLAKLIEQRAGTSTLN